MRLFTDNRPTFQKITRSARHIPPDVRPFDSILLRHLAGLTFSSSLLSSYMIGKI